MERPSKNINAANLLLLAALCVNSSPISAQNQPQQPKPQNPAAAQPAAQEQNRLEDDPAFKRLSPETRQLVRKAMDNLHKAIEDTRREVAQQPSVPPQASRRGQSSGDTLCGHAIVKEAAMMAGAAHDDEGKTAFVARWLDPESDVVHTAVLTSNGCIAADDQTIDGKKIVRVLPNSLAINKALVAYEAEYWNVPFYGTGNAQPHRGVFIGSRFAFELDARKASPLNSSEDAPRDFTLIDGGNAIPRQDVLLLPSAAQPSKPQTLPPALSGCGDVRPKKSALGFHLPKSVQKQIDKTTKQIADKAGVELDPNAPADAIKDAQTTHPCPATPAKP